MMKLRHTFLSVAIAMGISSVNAETIVVSNTNASGAGSLTQAILDANANSNQTTIEFNIPGTGDRIINGSDYPAFTAPVLVTTSGSQTGRTVLKAPIINGPGAVTTGFTFNAAAHNSIVQFVTFQNFVLSISISAGEVSVVNNNFENNIGGADVRLVYGPASFIKGNTFNGNGYAIAGVGGSSLIIGNTFIKEGISIGGAGGVTIGGANSGDPNTFTNIQGDAISFTLNGGTIYGNTINGATGVGINLQGVDNLISHNTISGVTGYDIVSKNGWYNRIISNQVTGDNGIFNGLFIKNGDAYTINNNTVTGGAIELDSIVSSNRGPVIISGNVISNDPTGYSAHGALTLSNVNGATVSQNEIHHNAGQGVYLYNSSNNTVVNNTIYENGRVGIYVQNGLYDKLSKNVITNNHADAGGGRTGIFLNNSNANKTAPVITSVKRVGSNFVITGTGTVANDTVELFLSDRASRNSTLTQNAISYLASVGATGTSWTATVSAANNNSGEVYIIATATSSVNNTSMFSAVKSVELNGPTAATTNHGSTYSAEYIPGASYSFWSTLPVNSIVQNGNSATFYFNQPGSGTVSVGYTDPTTGAWKQYSLNVTVYGPAKQGGLEESYTSSVEVYPNPFASATKVKVDRMPEENITLNLYDVNGSLVFQSTGHKEGEEIEVGNNLLPGIYTLQMVGGKEVKTVRIVKGQ